MKNWVALVLLTATVATSSAVSFTFKPNDGEGDTDDVFDLEHQYAYSWGTSTSSGSGQTLRSLLNSGYTVTNATIKVWNIWDWQVEQDILNIRLLNGTATGLRVYEDNPTDSFPNSDYFSPASRSGGQIYYTNQIALTTWSDPVGGVNNGFDLVYAFDATEKLTLASWIQDGGTFGLGFDPDCHYFNTGIEWCIEVTPTPTENQTVPDGGSTAALLGLALLGVGAIRSKFQPTAPRVS
jgi:hypothetical protein